MLTERARYERCLTVVLGHEGGLSDHARDPGGITNKGVTLPALREAGVDVDKDGDIDRDDIKKLTVKDASKVYRPKYWLAAECDQLPAGLDLLIFDTAVNMGPARARRYLQTAAGVDVDGIIGPQTLKAIGAAGPRRIIYAVELLRKNFYWASPNFDVFGRGWLRRLSEVTSQALRWAD